jgi:hypothetical protein
LAALVKLLSSMTVVSVRNRSVGMFSIALTLFSQSVRPSQRSPWDGSPATSGRLMSAGCANSSSFGWRSL